MLSTPPSTWHPVDPERPAAAPPPVDSPRARRPRARLAALLLAVAFSAAVVAVAADRWTSSLALGPRLSAAVTAFSSVPPAAPVAAGRSSAPATAAPAAPAAPAAAPPGAAAPADAAQQAVQQAIQHSNDDQVQAFATNTPSLMAETSTAAFYQQQVQVNQDLRNSGVQAFRLMGIEWGAITVNGTTATATTFETWSTTFADSTSEWSRDRNVYTLVQENGTWKVQAADHPDNTPASGGAPGSPASGGSTPGGIPGTRGGSGDPSTGRQPQPRTPHGTGSPSPPQSS